MLYSVCLIQGMPCAQAAEARCADLEAALGRREQGGAGDPVEEGGVLAAQRPEIQGEEAGHLAAAVERAAQLQAELAAVKDYARSLGAQLAAAQAAHGNGALWDMRSGVEARRKLWEV